MPAYKRDKAPPAPKQKRPLPDISGVEFRREPDERWINLTRAKRDPDGGRALWESIKCHHPALAHMLVDDPGFAELRARFPDAEIIVRERDIRR